MEPWKERLVGLYRDYLRARGRVLYESTAAGAVERAPGEPGDEFVWRALDDEAAFRTYAGVGSGWIWSRIVDREAAPLGGGHEERCVRHLESLGGVRPCEGTIRFRGDRVATPGEDPPFAVIGVWKGECDVCRCCYWFARPTEET